MPTRCLEPLPSEGRSIWLHRLQWYKWVCGLVSGAFAISH